MADVMAHLQQLSKALAAGGVDKLPRPDEPLLATLQEQIAHLFYQLHETERRRIAHEEQLSEVQLNYVLARQDAQARIQEMENLLDGLRSLTQSFDSGATFHNVLNTLRRVLFFEHALVLTGKQGEPLKVIATTLPAFAFTNWVPQALFKRVLEGQTVAAFDVNYVPEWQAQPPAVCQGVMSALHVFLSAGENPAMLICTHSAKGFFTKQHITLAQRFSLLATQALQNAELYLALRQERDSLEQRVEERTHDLARARDEAIAASRFKSELLANVSHELRTPLNAIIGYSEMLQSELQGPLTSAQQEMLRRIIVNGGELLTEINQLLDQAQIESGRLKIQMNWFTPSQLLDNLLSGLSVLALNKGLALTTEIDPHIPIPLIGDVQRLHQILSNLVGNAIKFTKTGGVHVRVGLVSPAEWRIEVADTGIGIPVEALPTIFQPFRQVDSSITRQQAGFGLGLSIVYQLVELMGGRIRAESEVGQGSKFIITLPIITDIEAYA